MKYRNAITKLRGAAVAVGAAALVLGACPMLSVASAAEGSCPNEARRAEQLSTYLPNCRAYEQVTPAAKDSAEPETPTFGTREREMFDPTIGALPAFNGERMAWTTEYPGLGRPASTGLQYLSSRDSEGWSTEAVIPPQSPSTGLACPETPGIVGWSRNLTKGVLADGLKQEYGESRLSGEESFSTERGGCGHAEPALTEADGAKIKEPADFQNLFLRNNESGFYQLVNVTPATAPHPRPREGSKENQLYFPPNFLAGSAELEQVAFEDELPLTEEAERLSPEVEVACKAAPKGRACWEGHDDLYVWSEAQQPAVRLVSVLPDGRPAEGMLAGSTRNHEAEPSGEPPLPTQPINIADYRHAVSADGSRIFFEAAGNLYVRENGGAPQSALGAKSECTEPAKACTIQLDLPQGGTGAGGGGKWLGANAEGTKVFFTDGASAGLTQTTIEGSGANLYEYELPSAAGTPGTLIDLTPDTEAAVVGMSGMSEDGSYVYFVAEGQLVAGKGTSTAPNLYLSHEGAITFIATLNGRDVCDWTANTGCAEEDPQNPQETGLTARVSSNGRYLAFDSVNQLTAYVNTDPVTNEAAEEIYLYAAEGNQLACASCNQNPNVALGRGAAIDWPTTVDRDFDQVRNAYPQRNVSETGQVFFETSEELLPDQETNGVRNVYEYEDGAQHLISSGVSAAPSYFLGASASGSDVFFATAQKLLPRDTDTAYDIYDARIDGGFSEPPTPPPPCESECKGAAGASAVFSAPDSTTFTGPGNVVQMKTTAKPKKKKKGKEKKKGKKEKKKGKKEKKKGKKTTRKTRKATRRDRRGVAR